jgi:hypothetical protein
MGGSSLADVLLPYLHTLSSLIPAIGIPNDLYFEDSPAVEGPAIDVFVHNIGLGPGFFRGFRASYQGILEEVLTGIGEHIKNGEYEVMSLSASRYSVVLILRSKSEAEVLNALFFKLQSALVKNLELKKEGRVQVATRASEGV